MIRRACRTLFARDTATLVWMLLVLATIGTWWVGAAHGIGVGGMAATSLVLTAVIKAWLIGDYFMEARTLPRGLRLLYWAWLIGTAVTLVVMVNLP